MNGTVTVRCPVRPVRREFRGTPYQVALARDFVRRHLPVACPPAAAGEIALCVSEVATNAVRHTRSGREGHFAVVLRVDAPTIRVEVLDGGPLDEAVQTGHDEFDEGGRGLLLVRGHAQRVGYEWTRHSGRTWFEYTWADAGAAS